MSIYVSISVFFSPLTHSLTHSLTKNQKKEAEQADKNNERAQRNVGAGALGRGDGGRRGAEFRR